MSNLSDLLNPAPNTVAGAPSEARQLAPLGLDGQDHHSQPFQPDVGPVQNPRHHHAVMSPGLDVLAAAASNTLPLFSPTQERSLTLQVTNSTASEKETMSTETRTPREPTEQQSSSRLQQHHNAPDLDQETQTRTGDTVKSALSPYNSLTLGRNGAGTNDAPTPSQIPQSLLSNSPQLPENNLPGQIEQIHIKAELGETPDIDMKENPSPQIQSSTPAQYDPAPGTPLKNVTNISPASASRNEDPSAMPQKSKSGPPRKRAAPKKGTAVKPPSKKRKVETGSGKASPRTGTPNTSRASGTPVPKRGKQGSATPTRSSSVANPEDDDDDGELELFCICRKPDDHTVMIGCDGPCEDWFHTRCVNMTDEKVALISKWYCPNCAAEGHETEWKRMCRLDGCSNPARVEGQNRSKYCCNEHGDEFMSSNLFSNEKKAGAATNRRRRRDNNTDHVGNGGDEQDEEDDNRGGILRPGELKSLVDGVKDVVSFRKLGDGVLSPPDTASASPQRDTDAKIAYSAEERGILNDITQKRTQIEVRKQMLDDRATLVQLVDMRRKNVLAKLKEKEKSLKDICGYDARLSWSDEELNEWRTSKEGEEQLHTTVLHADPKLIEKESHENGEDAEVGLGVCKKKRCERHRTWFKIQQADLAMEKDEVRQKLRNLDDEEKGVKERAMIRSLEEAQAASEA